METILIILGVFAIFGAIVDIISCNFEPENIFSLTKIELKLLLQWNTRQLKTQINK